MAATVRFLMCPPDQYDVDYVINPWMEGNIHKPSRQSAAGQWQALYKKLAQDAQVEKISPQPGLPDMVFTANAGLAVGQKFVLSRFLHRERQGEEAHFKKWFSKSGFEIFELPADLPFEGAGDALLDRQGSCLWAGYGFRSELDSHPYLARWLDLEVISLRLIDPRFYHLDTCFCPLEGGWLLYYPQAFDAYSNRVIDHRVEPQKRVPVSEADAVRFACNAVNVGRRIFANQMSTDLRQHLNAAGFELMETPLSEFMKSGGSAKCLTLRLNESPPAHAKSFSSVRNRELKLEGHLLDSGLLDRALELTVQSGGSFQILRFNLGKQRQSTSNADIKVSAPSEEILDKVMGQMIELGAVVDAPEEKDAQLKRVTKA